MPLEKIILPPTFKDLSPPAGRLAVEHAALDCRIHATFLALAISIPGEIAFFTDSLERVRHLLDTWLEGEKVRVRRKAAGKFFSFQTGDGTTLWLVTPAAKPDSLFFMGSLAAAFVTDAEAFDWDVAKTLSERGPSKPRGPGGKSSSLRCLYVSGQFVGVDSWFYRYCHDRHTSKGWQKAPRLRRLDCDAVVKAFPDQAPRILPKDDPRYPWAMRLRNARKGEHAAPIIAFARKRLKIRTDLRPEDLSDRQRGEMEAALAGDKWAPGSSFTVSLEFGAVQRRILAMKRLGRQRGFRKFITLKYRRAGMTVVSQAEAYYHCLRRPKSYVPFIAHKKETVDRLFETLKTFALCDPHSPGLKGKPTQDEIRFNNGSHCFIGTGKAEGLLRGETISYLHASEIPYYFRGSRAISLMNQTMAGIEESARHGEINLEFTARGVEWGCMKYREARKGLNDYWPIFIPWFFDPTCRLLDGDFNERAILDTLSERERFLVTEHALTPGQIAFRRSKLREYGALFLQEFPEDDESCFMSAGAMWFNPDKVTLLSQTVQEAPAFGPGNTSPPWKKRIGGVGYEARWQDPVKGVEYVAGCDSSEGRPGGDMGGVGILRRDTFEQVASIHGLFTTPELAAHAVRLCTEYNKALLGVEKENHGHAVLDRVESLGYGRSHALGGTLYYHGADAGNRRGGVRGWTTNEKTRTQIIEDLAAALDDGSLIVNDRDFISEMTTFCRQSSGRWDHDPGAHDDTIFKWGIALQMTKHRRLVPNITWVERGA